jgi:hypothetical protein
MIEAASRLTAQGYDLDYAICYFIGAIALRVRYVHKKHKAAAELRENHVHEESELIPARRSRFAQIISHHDMQSHRIFIQGNDVHNCPDLQSKNMSRTGLNLSALGSSQPSFHSYDNSSVTLMPVG